MNDSPPTARCAQTGMLIRRPVATTFAAFVEPDQITKFWFTHSSGKLEPGKTVTWRWEMYDATTQVTVQEWTEHERIQFQWEGYDSPTTVTWRFIPLADDQTFVAISECGFTATGDVLVEQVAGATGGWTLVLAGLKAYLEHGVQLGLVADRFPAGLPADL